MPASFIHPVSCQLIVSTSVYLYIYLYAYMYVYTYICIYMCVCIYIYVHTHTHTHTHTYTHIHTHTYIHRLAWSCSWQTPETAARYSAIANCQGPCGSLCPYSRSVLPRSPLETAALYSAIANGPGPCRQALKSPHTVGLFCPYSRPLLWDVLSNQQVASLSQVRT